MMTKENPAALAVVEAPPPKRAVSTSFAPTNFRDAIEFAKWVSETDMVPRDYIGKASNVLVAMQLGAEVGLPPMAAIQNIATINGRPAIFGDAQLAIVMASDQYEWHREWIEDENSERMAAHFEVKRRGQEPYHVKYSVNDAKIAHLWGKKTYKGEDTPWITAPKRMLQFRARSFGLRDKFPDVLKGLALSREEACDIPPEPMEPIPPRRQTGVLTPSKEPNRGHGGEGMVEEQLRSGEAEVEKATSPVAEEKPEEKPAKPPGSGPRKDSQAVKAVVTRVTRHQTEKGVEYRTLYLNDGVEDMVLYCYHGSLLQACDFATGGKGVELLFHVEKGKKFVDEIVSIAGEMFKQGKPVA